MLWSDKASSYDSDIYSKFGATSSGTLYFPSSQLEMEDNVVWTTDCIRIVAYQLELDKKSKYNALNPGANCSNNITDIEKTVVLAQ